MSVLDLGIDLGTANIIISAGRGAVLNEPTVIAFDKNSERVIAFGEEAYKMIGRAPDYIAVVKPLRDGVITNNDMAQELIRLCILKVIGKRLINPRIVMCVPSGVTTVEKKAVVESAVSAGARTVYLIEEPVAALLGAGEDIMHPFGRMVNASIQRYIADTYKVLIGERMAEEAKIECGNMFWASMEKTGEVSGRSLVTGLPTKLKISEDDICRAITEDVDAIIATVRSVFERTPPELVGDIYDRGIVLTGGGALLRGLDMYITREFGVKCTVADDPLGCVARGTLMAFKVRDKLRNGFEKVNVSRL